MTKKTQQVVDAIAKELLEQLTIVAQVLVSEKDNALWVEIESDERGILIGYHGRSLEAIQILLGQLVYKKLGTWVRIVVSVGDYRLRREQQLKDMAAQAAARVTESGEPVVLTRLTPAERRIVHLELEQNSQVFSESEGDGRDRRLVVKLRS